MRVFMRQAVVQPSTSGGAGICQGSAPPPPPITFWLLYGSSVWQRTARVACLLSCLHPSNLASGQVVSVATHSHIMPSSA